MKTKEVWIRISDRSEIEEAQHFILSLGEEDLLGDIRVALFVAASKETVPLSHIYDISEKAFIPLCEKYGEENVRLSEVRPLREGCDHDQNPEPDYPAGSMVSLLHSIAEALAGIESSLEDISASLGSLDSNLDACTGANARDEKWLNIGGMVDVNRYN